ncbi:MULTISPECIES: M23 family metallopeptidase [Bacillus cereus group]|uniref:M23 family metallopeptidase n=1 Tax=Bacillus pseudomycoides TaxID=64104 RepID=A0AAJ2DN78_9BACI|nr:MULTISPECIES: M23 family metallopeptidase [Bacillus cereus group]EEM12507.1 Peptidase, M23/M37 [Bacillus pseudomycoides]MBJ8030072.1 M23 family metallopeptidase [Bacillus cereus group sp. N21]MDR4327133.1 M23 family metallopeptidase [Bacillus pseudomycoides]MED1537663.1 M23 family metallopeptidase [Bacillus pseudomycoides]PDZ09948.1 M23 family peptidase [Bacillus pseudomycoides]
MKQKATALTATTVAVASLLPSITQVDTRTIAAQELPTQNTQYIKTNLKILYSNNKIKTRNNANSVKNTNISTSTKRKNSYIVNVGDQVQTGELLGHMENTGHSFGQHLHFELHNGEWNFEKTNAVNPLQYLVR